MEILSWLNENKEWVFSGLGIFLLTIAYQFFKPSKKITQNTIKLKGNNNKIRQSGKSDKTMNSIDFEGDENDFKQKG